jgi:hypothetical protein
MGDRDDFLKLGEKLQDEAQGSIRSHKCMSSERDTREGGIFSKIFKRSEMRPRSSMQDAQIHTLESRNGSNQKVEFADGHDVDALKAVVDKEFEEANSSSIRNISISPKQPWWCSWRFVLSYSIVMFFGAGYYLLKDFGGALGICLALLPVIPVLYVSMHVISFFKKIGTSKSLSTTAVMRVVLIGVSAVSLLFIAGGK